jgi:hypothetical protein
MAEPKQEKKQPVWETRSVKSYVIETIVSFLIVALLCVGVALADVFARQISFELEPLRVLGDAFGVAGLFGVSLWMLVWLSTEGAFDIIVYGVRKVFNVTFQHMMANSTLPDSYADYVAMKRAKKHDHHYPFSLISFVFFVIGLILSLCAL